MYVQLKLKSSKLHSHLAAERRSILHLGPGDETNTLLCGTILMKEELRSALLALHS